MTKINTPKIKYTKRKRKSKIKLLCISTLIVLLIILFPMYKYNNLKYANLDYAIKHYTTDGLFNKNKLYSLDNYTTKFSNNTFCIVEVTGTDNNPPYKTIVYDLHLEKNSKGIWKLIKVYYKDELIN